MLSFTDKAKEKVHYFLNHAQGNMVLRIGIKGVDKGDFTYHFGLEAYDDEKENDLTVAQPGFHVRMDSKTSVKMGNAVVDWIMKDQKEGFAVANPNSPNQQLTDDAGQSLYDRIVHRIKTIYDPEIPVDIYELGLIYEIQIDEKNNVSITMTLTAPNCPVAETLPTEVKNKIQAMDEVASVDLTLTWDPAWTPERMSEEARLDVGL